jgi:hypothetical protein
MKVIVSRQTAPDETMGLEANASDAEVWPKIKAGLAELDARMLERNMRYVHALKVVEAFPSRYHAAVKTLIDGLLSGGGQGEILAGIAQVMPSDRVAELEAELAKYVPAADEAPVGG